MKIKSIFYLLLCALVVCGCNKANQTDSSAQTLADSIDLHSPKAKQLRLQALSESIEANPTEPLNYFRRANILLEHQSYELALADMITATRLDSSKGEYFVGLAKAYRGIGRISMGLYACDKADQLEFDMPELYSVRGRLYLVIRQYNQALANLDTALQKDPYNAQTYYFKGQVLEETSDTTKAISSYQTAIEQDPSLIDAYNKLAVLMMARKQWPLAWQYLQSGLRFSPSDAFLQYNTGIYFYKHLNNADTATHFFALALKKEPGLTQALTMLGYIRFEQKKYEQSLEYLSKSLAQDSLQPDVYYFAGLASEFVGRREEALLLYQKNMASPNVYQIAAQKRYSAINTVTKKQRLRAPADSLS